MDEQQIIATLKKTPVFENLSDDELRQLASYCKEVRLSEGDVFLHEGEK